MNAHLINLPERLRPAVEPNTKPDCRDDDAMQQSLVRCRARHVAQTQYTAGLTNAEVSEEEGPTADKTDVDRVHPVHIDSTPSVRNRSW
jgi:hypothetical protein